MLVEVRLLGGFDVALDGQPLPSAAWRRRQASGLLKLLALEPGHRMHRERVIDVLWPGLAIDEAAPRLHKSAHFIRAATGHRDAVVLNAEVVALFPNAEIVVDVDRFLALTGDGTAEGSDGLTAGLELYRGDLLPDDRYQPWLDEPRERLHLRYLDALRRAGRWEELVAADPTDEDANLRLVRAHLDRGDRAGALRRLDHLETSLRRALDVEPSAATIAMREEAMALPIEAPAPGLGGDGVDFFATMPRAPLPAPLTPFIGRTLELAAVVDAVREHRLVTVTGPGGVGKTRLAITAARVLEPELRDGAAYVDLVAVTRPDNLVAAVADGVGVPERVGTDREGALLTALAERELLIVIDNCEHVVNGVRLAVERLLGACPGVRVLATSRVRLMLPFERVYTVPGLSVQGDHGADAVELFVARLTATGAPAPADESEWETVGRICRALEGMALAIELAAARAPGLALTELEQALAAQLSFLSGGHRVDRRHESLRATIDWSYDLLNDDERRVLRAASVFAGPLDSQSLATVMDLPVTVVRDSLARLVDWNLVSLGSGSARPYRVLETIRQYGAARADETGEGDETRSRHLRWVRSTLQGLLARLPPDDTWCTGLDLVLDDARAAAHWASCDAERRDAATLAELLAAVTFQRGHPGEAQRHYQNAAAWNADPTGRHRCLRLAAGAATTRNVAGDAVELFEQAAELALGAGLPDVAAEDFAHAAMLQRRTTGIVSRPIVPERVDELMRRARATCTRDVRAEAVIALADGWAPGAAARSAEATASALAGARAIGDRLLENIALDQLTVIELARDDVEAAVAAVAERVAVMAQVPVDASSGFEFYDIHQMGCVLNLATGSFRAAREHAEALAALVFLREQRHIAVGRRLEIEALAGDFDIVVSLASSFEADWVRAGRPVVGNLAPSALAASMAHGMIGHADQRQHWLDIATALVPAGTEEPALTRGFGAVVDAIVALHRGDIDTAIERLGSDLDDVIWNNPNRRVWRSWYAGLWAEASVLSAHRDTDERLARAAIAAKGNIVATAMVERAAALHRGALDELDALEARFAAADAPYQAARTAALSAAG